MYLTLHMSATVSQLSSMSITEGKYPVIIKLAPHRQFYIYFKLIPFLERSIVIYANVTTHTCLFF